MGALDGNAIHYHVELNLRIMQGHDFNFANGMIDLLCLVHSQWQGWMHPLCTFIPSYIVMSWGVKTVRHLVLGGPSTSLRSVGVLGMEMDWSAAISSRSAITCNVTVWLLQPQQFALEEEFIWPRAANVWLCQNRSCLALSISLYVCSSVGTYVGYMLSDKISESWN